jgi:hypothetical protein
MLHTVVIDAEALAALDRFFTATGKPLPRSPIVDRRGGIDWHAIPIDSASVVAIQNLRSNPDEPFNDTLRNMLDLPPLTSVLSGADRDRPRSLRNATRPATRHVLTGTSNARHHDKGLALSVSGSHLAASGQGFVERPIGDQ